MQRRGKKIEKGAVHARVDAFPELYPSGDANEKKKDEAGWMKNGGSFDPRNMNILLNESRRVSGQFFTGHPRIIRRAKNARCHCLKNERSDSPAVLIVTNSASRRRAAWIIPFISSY